MTKIIAKYSCTSLYPFLAVWPQGICLEGVLSINLQKPYLGGRGGYNSWGDGTYHIDTLEPMVQTLS